MPDLNNKITVVIAEGNEFSLIHLCAHIGQTGPGDKWCINDMTVKEREEEERKQIVPKCWKVKKIKKVLIFLKSYKNEKVNICQNVKKVKQSKFF